MWFLPLFIFIKTGHLAGAHENHGYYTKCRVENVRRVIPTNIFSTQEERDGFI